MPKKAATAKKKAVKAAPKKKAAKKAAAPKAEKKAAPKKASKAAAKPAAEKTAKASKIAGVKAGLAKQRVVVKNNFTTAQNKEFIELLLRKRNQLLSDIAQMEDGALKAFDSSLSTIHIAELGSDVFEQDLTLGLVEKDSAELRQIHDALQRIADSTYGMCEGCSKEIPVRRLQVIPFARFCVPCKEKYESEMVLGAPEELFGEE